MNLDKIREDFPLLQYWTFLNAGGMMIPGKYWLEAAHEFFDFQEKGRIDPWDIASHPFLSGRAMHAKEEAAKLINAKKREVTNMYRIMTASNLIINDMLDWKKGDNVVFTDLAYPSIPFILLNLSRKKGVELRRVENDNGKIHMSDLDKKVDDDTRLVCINRTTPFCGFTYNVEEVCKIAHERNAFVLDDAFQAIGVIDVDVKKDDVDFLLTGSYKWQCGPEGAGIFYVKENLIDELECSFQNYLAAKIPGEIPFTLADHDNISSWDYTLRNDADRFDQGVCVGEVLFAWDATLKYLNDLGPKNIQKRVRMLGGYLIEKLRDSGCKVLTPIEPEERHGLIMYTTGRYKRDSDSFNTFASQPKPIKVSIRSAGGIGGIRVCTHFFNTEEDIDRLIEVQKKLIR
ncbi:MAG: aminotransferase class V-fold PLP-dependent enzyme [Thermoproteota archaeon]|nr:aminotransferase class V-fold PLP-dependent enzyme [Thermoproteota archaeon]